MGQPFDTIMHYSSFPTFAAGGPSEARLGAITNESVPAFATFTPMHARLLATFRWHDVTRRSDGARILILGIFSYVHRLAIDDQIF